MRFPSRNRMAIPQRLSRPDHSTEWSTLDSVSRAQCSDSGLEPKFLQVAVSVNSARSIAVTIYKNSSCMKILTGVRAYRVSRGECARLRQNVPYVKVHRYNPKHLHTYIRSWTVTEIMAWEKCGLLVVTRTVPVSRVVIRTLPMSVLQSHSQVKHIPPSLSTHVTVTVNCNS